MPLVSRVGLAGGDAPNKDPDQRSFFVTGGLNQHAPPLTVGPTARLRIAILVVLAVGWEALSMSGLLFQDVVPSLGAIAAALARVIIDPSFWSNAGVTAVEIGGALLAGGTAGLAVGFLLGSSDFLRRSFEPYLFYLGPTPKIILFPVLIMAFGVGWNSKIAMGALSCFFPIALSTVAAMAAVDRVLIKVGRSLRLNWWQMATKIYLPAIRLPVINGFRLGFGVAVIGVLLAETKLSNQGVGYLVMQGYSRFDMPETYALLILVFAFAMAANAAFTRATELKR